MQDEIPIGTLDRIAEALERLSPPPPPPVDWSSASAFFWHEGSGFAPVPAIPALPLELLKGIEPQAALLLENTRRFVHGLPANHALLWGARGTGKSSLVKSVHRELSAEKNAPILLEIAREDIASLSRLLAMVKGVPRRFLLLCDDLSFDAGDASYKSLKSVLDGGIEGRPENVLFYATSNRRHLMPREMVENESAAAIHPGEAVDEKVSLSDRFGLWLGFHHVDQPTYLAMVDAYAAHFRIEPPADLHIQALRWASGRGARSGRVAWQFFVDLTGRLGRTMSF